MSPPDPTVVNIPALTRSRSTASRPAEIFQQWIEFGDGNVVQGRLAVGCQHDTRALPGHLPSHRQDAEYDVRAGVVDEEHRLPPSATGKPLAQSVGMIHKPRPRRHVGEDADEVHFTSLIHGDGIGRAEIEHVAGQDAANQEIPSTGQGCRLELSHDRGIHVCRQAILPALHALVRVGKPISADQSLTETGEIDGMQDPGRFRLTTKLGEFPIVIDTKCTPSLLKTIAGQAVLDEVLVESFREGGEQVQPIGGDFRIIQEIPFGDTVPLGMQKLTEYRHVRR